MRRALALCLALASCSSDPAPATDAGPADTGSPTDLGTADTGSSDAGQPDDTGSSVDLGAPADAPADLGPLDAGAPVDVSPAADSDVSPGPGDDAAADAGPADIPSVGLDTGPRDAGATDAAGGAQTYPLDPPPAETQVRVLYVETCRDRDGGPCADSVPTDQTRNASCRRTGTRLAFAFTPCVSSIPCSDGLSVTGAFPDYRSVAGATVTVVGGGPTQGRDFVIESGSVVGGRQSFRVSFSAPPTSSVPGVTGAPGRTLSPDRGDVWLLGCPVQ